jgi:STE24 endopeptidase
VSLVVAIIIAAIILSGFLNIWLLLRQIRAVRANRDEVPAELSGQVSLAEHQRAADYTVAHAKLAMVQSSFGAILAVLWLVLLLAPLHTAIAAFISWGHSLAIVVAVALIGYLLNLPFVIFSVFGIEARYGFNRTKLHAFVIDQLKACVLMLFSWVPILFVLFVLFLLPGPGWLSSWAILTWWTFYLSHSYRFLIKYSPMSEGPMKTSLEALLKKCRFASRRVVVISAAKRSAHSNAFLIGIGKARRIILLDTLLERFTPDEVLAIVAHELGHHKFGHNLQRLLQWTALSFLIFFVVHWALTEGSLAREFGLPNELGIVLIIVINARQPMRHIISLVTNFLWRRQEFQADGFAKKMVGKELMIGALTKLYRDNLLTLTPDRIYALFVYAHPPLVERIAHLKEA